jgi:hypothetical protein
VTATRACSSSSPRLRVRVAEGVQPPKAGSLFFAATSISGGEPCSRSARASGSRRSAAPRGCRVIATDVVPAAVECARANAVLNGVADKLEVRLGDCFEPVRGQSFDLICTSPPQMPTPPGREREDPAAAADNGGVDGWELLDRVIAGAPAHLETGGRLVFTMFGFLGPKGACARLEAAGLEPSILARETHNFPRIGYERLDHIRGLDAEATLPAAGMPATVERLVVQGIRRR